MIPKIVHTALMGGYRPDALGERCMESWRRVLPDYEIRVWTDENTPRSPFCDAAIASRPVNASHYAQYRALLDNGGVFLDCDVEVVRQFDLKPEVFCGFQRSETIDCCVNNAVVGAMPGHPFIRRVLERIEASDPATWPLISGPGAITDTLVELGMNAPGEEREIAGVMVYDKERFYPWSWEQPAIPVEQLSERTFACHWWAGSWKP